MSDDSNENNHQPARRDFFKFGAGAIAGLTAVAGSSSAFADDFSPFEFDPSVSPSGWRARKAFRLKIQAAQQHLITTLNAGVQNDNNDEQRYADENYYASFTKTLPSNQFGEVDPSAFEALQLAMREGQQQFFDSIPLDPTAARKLANPQGAFRYEIAGLDSHGTRMAPSWEFRSPELAGEMAEVYWQAITRDVPFIEYGSSNLVANAVADLNQFVAPPGAAANGVITADTLFRGETPGDLIGPYISQLLWKPFKFGPVDVDQRYESGVPHLDFMKDHTHWLNVQRGGAPLESAVFDSTKRYIFDNRSLSEYVHRDALYQAYLHGALVLLGYGADALDPGNPYRDEIANQGAFTSLGGPFIIDLVSKAANMALSGAWFQKWRVHRFLRPETLAGRVHFHATGQRNYELHSDILNSSALSELYSQNGSYFCPQAYIEGSPTHPSYPAGHATIAGACATVLKAFFDENFVFPDPVEANATGDALLNYAGPELSVGNEINKLANNIAIGRDAAGVHYRQDGIQGLIAGEQQAISLLQDQSRTIHEGNFDGFTFTKFDGTTVNIQNGNVTEI